jgi:hypothetical protein
LVLAKLAAQDDSQPGNQLQMFVAWYSDIEKMPRDESQITWKLTSHGSKNKSGVIERLQIASDGNAAWRIDEVRLGTTFDSVTGKIDKVATPNR